jgi:hypothetical protein
VIAPALAWANADPARANFNAYAGLCVQLRWGSHNQCGTGREREEKVSHDFLLSTYRWSQRTKSVSVYTKKFETMGNHKP